MNILIVALVILAGSVLESAFAWLFASRPVPGDAPEDHAHMDARYSRLNLEFDAA